MTILTLLMYGLATAHISLSLYQNLIAFFDQRAADGGLTVLNEVNSPLVYSQIAIEVINVSIVVYKYRFATDGGFHISVSLGCTYESDCDGSLCSIDSRTRLCAGEHGCYGEKIIA